MAKKSAKRANPAKTKKRAKRKANPAKAKAGAWVALGGRTKARVVRRGGKTFLEAK